MKLLHVIRATDPESGGPIEALLRFSEVWARDGHEVEIASLDSKDAGTHNAIPFPVTALGTGHGRYGYSSLLIPWLRSNAGRFDAVILHGLWNYSSLGSWRALKDLSTPYFIFTHGMMDPWFRKRYPLKHLAKQVFWWLGEGRVLHDARAVLFTCDEEMIRSRDVFSGPVYKERVVLLGTSDPQGDVVEERAAFAAAFPDLNSKRFLLFISRIHPKKGCDLLIRAFADHIAQGSDLDLVIAGPDQLGWSRELMSLTASCGIESRVHWPGMLKGKIKWGAFRSAEAMILPSHQENFGFVVAEAMACSTPVLISDKVNIWREVLAAQAGLVESDTAIGVRNLIERYFSMSSEDRVKMAEAARRGFVKYFDVDAAARNCVRLIGAEIHSAVTS